jgi:outer membrane protein TolC
MADIIDIKESPINRYRRELEQKDQEIIALRQQLEQAANALATVISINDMLKLQLSDLVTTLTNLHNSFGVIAENMRNLQAQLPDIRQQ